MGTHGCECRGEGIDLGMSEHEKQGAERAHGPCAPTQSGAVLVRAGQPDGQEVHPRTAPMLTVGLAGGCRDAWWADR